MKVVNFTDIKQELVNHLIDKRIVPILGSGFSFGSKTACGVVPNGKNMYKYMVSKIKEMGIASNELDGKKFQQIASYYNSLISCEERRRYLLENFLNVKLTQIKKSFLKINWPYIYTFNVDDAIEKNSSYSTVLAPMRQFFSKTFEDRRCVIKLHGDADEMTKYLNGDNFSVFDQMQYIKSLKGNQFLLTKLKEDFQYRNLIFVGCSLEEETDILSVFSELEVSKIAQVDRYFVSDHIPSKIQKIELEQYGITCVVVVDKYDLFYYGLYEEYQNNKAISADVLDSYLNIPVKGLNIGRNKILRYLLNGVPLFNIKERKITIPKFFISRNITKTILNDFGSTNIQIVYGRRISGKSYLLADIYRNIFNKNKYFFDSRTQLNGVSINKLLQKENSVIIVDTNVISRQDFTNVLQLQEAMKKRDIHFIIAIHSSDKDILSILTNDLPYTKCYELNHILTDSEQEEESEYRRLKLALNALNILNFEKRLSILDNIIMLQNIFQYESDLRLPNMDVPVGDRDIIASLILLAMKGKISSNELAYFSFKSLPTGLDRKQEMVFENDYRYLLNPDIFDGTGFQIVCNAQAWLLNQMSIISSNNVYFDTIIEAYHYLVSMTKKREMWRKKNFKNRDVEELIRFDTLNQIFRGDNKRGSKELIKAIYDNLQTVLNDSYNFHHQHAICLLWGVEESESINEDLKKSLSAALIADSTVRELLDKNYSSKPLQIAFAHIQFTLSMIKVKVFNFSPTKENFINAVDQLCVTMGNKYNLESQELTRNARNMRGDYSINGFINKLLEGSFKEYITNSQINQNVEAILNYFYEIRRAY